MATAIRGSFAPKKCVAHWDNKLKPAGSNSSVVVDFLPMVESFLQNKILKPLRAVVGTLFESGAKINSFLDWRA